MPVGQWGTDATLANNVPQWKLALGAGTQPGANNGAFANSQLLYANSTANAIIVNQRVGIFGMNSNTTAANVTTSTVHGNHAGWVLITQGSGPVVSITATGGTGYTNGQYLTISNTSVVGTVNAVANIATNSSGNVVSATLLSNNSLIGGKFYTANQSLLALAVANGSSNGPAGQTGASITLVFGGRAGRVGTETLVAMGSMTGNTSTPYYPSIA